MMLLITMLAHSSLFRFFALILSATFLVSFGDNRCVLAVINLGPDERFPAKPGVPDVSDYPNINEIRKQFLGMPKRATLIMAVSDRYTKNYLDFCRSPQLQKRCIFDAFPENYLSRDGRTERWYAKYYDDCNSVYLEAASGPVHVATDDGDVPNAWNCGYFENHEYPILNKELVPGVLLVNARDWTDQRLYNPGREADGGSGDGGSGNGGDGNLGNGGERDGSGTNAGGGTENGGGGNILNPGIVEGGAVGLITGEGVGTTRLLRETPPVYAGHRQDSQEDEQDPRLNSLDPDAKANIMLDSSSLGTYTPPSADHFTIPPATPDLGLPGTDSTSESDGSINYKENLNVQDLFQRRRRALRPRLDGICRIAPKDPPDASQLSNSAGSPSSVTPTQPEIDGIIPKLNALAPGIAEIATVVVTQYAKAPPRNRYTVDITIDAADGSMINNIVNQEAPPNGGEIEIEIPAGVELGQDKPTVKVPASPPLYLSLGENDEDPLKFRYGDSAMMSFGADFGLKFDSNDQSPQHQCVVEAWIREIPSLDDCNHIISPW